MNVLADPPCSPDELHAFLSALDVETLLTYTGHQVSWVRIDAKMEVDRRVLALPNIVEDAEGLTAGLCSFCGRGFPRDTILLIPNHFNSDGTCKNGFTADHRCPCGVSFETTREASKHRIQYDCLHRLARIEANKARRAEELKRLRCEPCTHQFHSQKDYDAHLGSKAHHKATHPDEFYCKDCDVRCTYKSEFARHLESVQHLKTQTPVSYTCEPCGVKCRCKAEYDRHCAGKFHRYTVNPTERPNLTCEVCGITRPSLAQYQAHLLTAKHQKKVAETQEDPHSPDDGDAEDSPDTQSPSPTHSPPQVC